MPSIMHRMFRGRMTKGCHHISRKDRYYSPPFYDLTELQPEPTPEEIKPLPAVEV